MPVGRNRLKHIVFNYEIESKGHQPFERLAIKVQPDVIRALLQIRNVLGKVSGDFLQDQRKVGDTRQHYLNTRKNNQALN